MDASRELKIFARIKPLVRTNEDAENGGVLSVSAEGRSVLLQRPTTEGSGGHVDSFEGFSGVFGPHSSQVLQPWRFK